MLNSAHSNQIVGLFLKSKRVKVVVIYKQWQRCLFYINIIYTAFKTSKTLYSYYFMIMKILGNYTIKGKCWNCVCRGVGSDLYVSHRLSSVCWYASLIFPINRTLLCADMKSTSLLSIWYITLKRENCRLAYLNSIKYNFRTKISTFI